MKIELKLDYAGAYSWSNYNHIYFIGYAFDEEGNLYQKAEDFKNLNLNDFIYSLRGAYAFISSNPQQLIATTDPIASFPLFYKVLDKSNIVISCNPDSNIKVWNSAAIEDFKKIYCTQHQDTLLKDWHSIPAGHQLHIDIPEQKLSVTRYFSHYSVQKKQSQPETEQKFIEIIQLWAKQVAQFAANRPIWIPLSGGYDSRLIISTLIKENIPNLHAYTYGKILSKEVITAQKVAKQLKLDWHFIPYNEQAFQYFFTDIWDHYADKNHHYQSLPHEQDFFALLALKSQGLLEEEFVVIPGFCGDIPTGGFLKKKDINTYDYIQKNHAVEAKNLVEDIPPWDSYQQWLCENRLSKFIVNSVRVYEYFGGKWMLPMWHKDFIQLFYELENQEKWNQKFYLNIIFKNYFEDLKIDFKKHPEDAVRAEYDWKAKIKDRLPDSILKGIRKMKKISSETDPCNLDLLYELLYLQMKKGNSSLSKDKNFNRLHALYMLEKIKKFQ